MSWGTENILGAFNLAIKSDSNVCLPTLYLHISKLDLHNSTLDLHIACTGFPILIETVKSDSSVSLNLDLQFEVHNLVLSVGDEGYDSLQSKEES